MTGIPRRDLQKTPGEAGRKLRRRKDLQPLCVLFGSLKTLCMPNQAAGDNDGSTCHRSFPDSGARDMGHILCITAQPMLPRENLNKLAIEVNTAKLQQVSSGKAGLNWSVLLMYSASVAVLDPKLQTCVLLANVS